MKTACASWRSSARSWWLSVTMSQIELTLWGQLRNIANFLEVGEERHWAISGTCGGFGWVGRVQSTVSWGWHGPEPARWGANNGMHTLHCTVMCTNWTHTFAAVDNVDNAHWDETNWKCKVLQWCVLVRSGWPSPVCFASPFSPDNYFSVQYWWDLPWLPFTDLESKLCTQLKKERQHIPLNI